jgi:murein DD-endopeptidase MepM/ murein hydrolase activator NlpD
MTDKSCKSRLLTAAGKSARLSLAVGACALAFSCNSTSRKATNPEAPAQRASPYSAQLLSGRATPIVDGSLVVVNVEFDRPFSKPVQGNFESKHFALYPLEGGKRFQGMFGIPHSHTPGPATVQIAPEGVEPVSLRFDIADAHYPSETLKVDNRKINPRKKDLIRIKKEVAEINQIYVVDTHTKFWNGPFAHPTDTITTDQFGMKRLYNGQLRSYHGGMDFRAAIGTPIHAANGGKVLLAKDLFYSGGTVIVDHGYGLLTMYFHMSKIIAKQGQMVSQGDLLGLSGKTGRVTGPHLHFQVVVHGTKVDPKDLFAELK